MGKEEEEEDEGVHSDLQNCNPRNGFSMGRREPRGEPSERQEMKGAGGIPSAPRFLHDLIVLPQHPIHTWVPVDRAVCVQTEGLP